jgi:hypothetical protein
MVKTGEGMEIRYFLSHRFTGVLVSKMDEDKLKNEA